MKKILIAVLLLFPFNAFAGTMHHAKTTVNSLSTAGVPQVLFQSTSANGTLCWAPAIYDETAGTFDIQLYTTGGTSGGCGTDYSTVTKVNLPTGTKIVGDLWSDLALPRDVNGNKFIFLNQYECFQVSAAQSISNPYSINFNVTCQDQ